MDKKQSRTSSLPASSAIASKSIEGIVSVSISYRSQLGELIASVGCGSIGDRPYKSQIS